ncbi:hemerythrin domain-containing protein [Halomonas sp. WWR20]
MTIFEALQADHDKLRTLLEQLVNTPTGKERTDCFCQAKSLLMKHLNAKERALYAAMLEFDLTQRKARQCVAQHHEIDELVEALDSANLHSDEWLASAEQLKHWVTRDLDDEEQEVFALVGSTLSEQQQTSMAKRYLREMQAEL